MEASRLRNAENPTELHDNHSTDISLPTSSVQESSTRTKKSGSTGGLLIRALPSLATFSILGVMIRFGLEILFGPKAAHITAKNRPLFIDLPANMVGCFFMGWTGLILKEDITEISPLLAVGLNTGLMGSITTFASWNQSMISSIVQGYYLHRFLAMLLGAELAGISYVVGMDTAKLVKKFVFRHECDSLITKTASVFRHECCCRRVYALKTQPEFLVGRKFMWIWCVAFAGMWIVCVIIGTLDVDNLNRRKLWWGCTVGPLCTWIRWYLSQLNGRGIPLRGRPRLNWFPIGTLIANFVACLMEAVVAINGSKSSNAMVKLAMGSLQLGLMGCMSTVSTMISEAHTLKQRTKPWQAYVYVMASFFSSMVFSIVLFSSPAWANKIIHIR